MCVCAREQLCEGNWSFYTNICLGASRCHAGDGMSCLCKEIDGVCDICGAEKQNLCLSEEGMQLLVSMNVTRCVRGFDLCGSVPPSSPGASIHCRCASILAALTTAAIEYLFCFWFWHLCRTDSVHNNSAGSIEALARPRHSSMTACFP